MNDYTTRKNILLAAILQVVTLINGFVVSKIVLSFLGAEVHGLVSSLTQFLGFISLLEGGVSGVTMAALYAPLNNKEYGKVSGILKATEIFFKKISIIYIIYAIILSVLYPLVIKTSFSWIYICSLILIIGMTTFIQYYFALVFRILLNADRKGYVVCITQFGMVVSSLIFTILVTLVYPEIHILKLISVISYVIQPIVFKKYVKRNYNLNFNVKPDQEAINQKWNGFGQNLAYFIHINTDVVILTIFSTLQNVSIYSVYAMISNALKSFCMSISSAMVPSMGKALVEQDTENNEVFDDYVLIIGITSLFLFTCGAVLVVPFVCLYTRGITGVQYSQPCFAILIMLAEVIYCFRDPYVQVVYSAGHFKQTAKFAYMEATINILVSLLLVKKIGLIGIAIGTFLGMVIRMICHVVYLRSNILFRPIKKWFIQITTNSVVMLISIILLKPFEGLMQKSYVAWIIGSVICALVIALIIFIAYFIVYRKKMSCICKKFYSKLKDLEKARQ